MKCLFSLSSAPFCRNLFGFYDASHGHRKRALCNGFSGKLLSAKRKNFQEMHFKPLNQAAMTEICIGKTKWGWRDKGEKGYGHRWKYTKGLYENVETE